MTRGKEGEGEKTGRGWPVIKAFVGYAVVAINIAKGSLFMVI